MKVARISKETAEKIAGVEYFNNVLFAPIQDADDRWIVSLIEASHLTEEWDEIDFNKKTEIE